MKQVSLLFKICWYVHVMFLYLNNAQRILTFYKTRRDVIYRVLANCYFPPHVICWYKSQNEKPSFLTRVSRSQLNAKMAKRWQPALTPTATKSVLPKPKMAWGKSLRWQLGQHCRPRNVARSPAAFCYRLWEKRELPSSTDEKGSFHWDSTGEKIGEGPETFTDAQFLITQLSWANYSRS